jgi:hypothetical protein
VAAHAQKPDFVFRSNGRVHLNRRGGEGSVRSTTGSRAVRNSGSNAGYTMFRGSVEAYWLPTPFTSSPFTSPSLASPCAITFQLDSNTPKVSQISLPKFHQVSYTICSRKYEENNRRQEGRGGRRLCGETSTCLLSALHFIIFVSKHLFL